MPFARELPGSYILELLDVPIATSFSQMQPGGRRRNRFPRRSLPHSLVGRRTVSLRGTVLGSDRSHEQRAFEDKDGIQTISPRGEAPRRFYGVEAEHC